MQANKWTSAGNIAPQVRSLRKPNNDQVAIAIDMDGSSQSLEDDDDKGNLLANGSKVGNVELVGTLKSSLLFLNIVCFAPGSIQLMVSSH